MTAGAGPEPVTTGSRRLVPGEAGAGGYRTLVAADGERHLVRDDLAGMSLPAGWRRSARPLLVIAHLSDTHVMDHQSPGRAELFDRYSDPDSPVRAEVGVIGTYRAQELFTYQVAEAMVRAVRHAKTAPLSGAPVDPADPAVLAALARELAANDWQVRDQISAEGGAGAGIEADRNVLLAIDWPRPVSRTGLRAQAYLLPQSTRCHHRRVSSTCHVNCRGGLSFQPWRHRPSGSRQSPGQSPAQCRQCLVRLTSATCYMIGLTDIRTTKRHKCAGSGGSPVVSVK